MQALGVQDEVVCCVLAMANGFFWLPETMSSWLDNLCSVSTPKRALRVIGLIFLKACKC